MNTCLMASYKAGYDFKAHPFLFSACSGEKGISEWEEMATPQAEKLVSVWSLYGIVSITCLRKCVCV